VAEIQLTDGIASLMNETAGIGLSLSRCAFDCGSKLGYLQAMVEFGFAPPRSWRAFADYLKSRQ